VGILASSLHVDFSEIENGKYFLAENFWKTALCGRIILKWVLEKYNMKMWSEFNWQNGV
jgi:hypothetical protein